MSRHRGERRRPRLAPPRAIAAGAVLAVVTVVTVVAVTAAASSAGSGAVQAESVSGRSSAASTTAAPAQPPAPAVVPPGATAVAPSAVAPSPMPRSAPVRLQIQAIGVDSELMDLGLADDGTMQVPPDGFPAGWYTGAPTPGELGPAVIAGHVDWGGEPGVFYDLRDLKQGDEIAVTRQDGSVAVFRVTFVEQFPKDEFPTDAVYGDIDHAGLRLITCGGSFDRQARHYVDNVIAFAELVRVSSA